jgi:phage terminase large subunit-like protein
VVRAVPEQAPGDVLGTPGLEVYKHWKPDFQAKALEQLQASQNNAWKPFFCPRTECTGHGHFTPAEDRECGLPNGHVWEVARSGQGTCVDCGVTGMPEDDWTWEHCRKDQRPPPWRDPWQNTLYSSGRGSGKTRTGSEVSHQAAKITPRLTFIAATGPDFRETMVEGRSGLLATAKPGERPTWEPSRKRLVWPNGAIGQGFSAEEPDRLRGPEHGFVWADEPSHYLLIDDVWTNMEFGLRVSDKNGRSPKVILTTTPKANKWTKERDAEDITVVRRVSSYFNTQNLAESYQRNVIRKHEGTRLGDQEIHGMILEDVEGALWTGGIISHIVEAPPHLDRIVVSVDPAGSTDPRADETGIIVIARLGSNQYVLADLTGKYTPDQWGRKVWAAVDYFAADAIVAERNYGGQMVRYVLETTKQYARSDARVKDVNSRRGKKIRAEPVVARYEQGRVLHVAGPNRLDLKLLEEEQLTWVPGEGPSPNRVDALVHGSTELGGGGGPAVVADPAQLARDGYRFPVPGARNIPVIGQTGALSPR